MAAPGTRPRLGSSNPNHAVSAAKRKSQAMAISAPPATARPLTAAISGFVVAPKPNMSVTGKRRWPVRMRPPWGDERSLPEQKASPAPVTIPTYCSGSASNARSSSPISCMVSSSYAFFFSGRFNVKTVT